LCPYFFLIPLNFTRSDPEATPLFSDVFFNIIYKSTFIVYETYAYAHSVLHLLTTQYTRKYTWSTLCTIWLELSPIYFVHFGVMSRYKIRNLLFMLLLCIDSNAVNLNTMETLVTCSFFNNTTYSAPHDVYT